MIVSGPSVSYNSAADLFASEAQRLHTTREHLGFDGLVLLERSEEGWLVQLSSVSDHLPPLKRGDKLTDETMPNQFIAGALSPSLNATPSGTVLATRDHSIPVGAGLFSKITRSDGSLFGLLFGFSNSPEPMLNPRDLRALDGLAQRLEYALHKHEEDLLYHTAIRDRIVSAMEEGAFTIVFQSIHELGSERLLGLEALCRFETQPFRSPDQWFSDAAAVGLGLDLETQVFKRTVDYLEHIPTPAILSVNVSAEFVAHGDIPSLLKGMDVDQLTLEIGEHGNVSDVQQFQDELACLRGLGLRIALDDADGTYAQLEQLTELKPDLIKIDRALISDINETPARQILCAGLAHYAKENGCVLIGEGVEAEAEAIALHALGAKAAQGWFFARPVAFQDALSQLSAAS